MASITITATCTSCNTDHDLSVDEKGFNRWKNGELIQVALPELSSSERELLISNTCQKCWDELFAEVPEEDNYNQEDGNEES